jgi:hypothetical protein
MIEEFSNATEIALKNQTEIDSVGVPDRLFLKLKTKHQSKMNCDVLDS